MQPRLVLRDITGDYCINGLAPATYPSTLQTGVGTFKLSRTTPTYVLYQEVAPEGAQVAS